MNINVELKKTKIDFGMIIYTNKVRDKTTTGESAGLGS